MSGESLSNHPLAFPPPPGGEDVLSPLFFIIFLKSFLEKYETKCKYPYDSTSLCSPSESIQCSVTPEEFCRKWRLLNNAPKTELILFHVQNINNQYRTTKPTKVSGVWLDRHMNFKDHVDHLKALNFFTWNSFQCIIRQANKRSSRLKIFNLYIRPRIDFSPVL